MITRDCIKMVNSGYTAVRKVEEREPPGRTVAEEQGGAKCISQTG